MLDVTEGGGAEKADGRAPPVFISYASQDATVADAVVGALERAGLKCWIAPRDVTPGTFYADEIVHAIDAAKASVLILSQHAAGSAHVLREVERAASKRHPVVSLRIDQAPLPAGLEYFLNTSQWLEASTGGRARSIPKLVAAVRLAIDKTMTQDAAMAEISARASSPAVGERSLRRVVIVAGSLLAAAIGGFEVYQSWHSARRMTAPAEPAAAAPTPSSAPAAAMIPEKSIAVLPFVDMSEKRDQEYFSDGLSEELIDMLARVPELRVPASTSSFYFKGKQTTIPEIAKALGVANVLEGSVRKSGNTLRITAQLIRVDNGYHVWSETYDRKVGDIFKIQHDIASAVVKTLKLSLLDSGSKHGPVTGSPDAYTLYLQGRFFGNRATARDTEISLDFLRQALRLDPEFAAAWAELSRRYADTLDFGLLRQQQARELALRAAERALALDPSLPEAHIALGKTRLRFDWAWAAADAEMAKARTLDPANADALAWGGYVAKTLGRLDEALRLGQQAIAHDPLNEWHYAGIAEIYECLGRLAEAKAALGKTLDLNPAHPGAHAFMGRLMLLEGEDAAAALAEIGRESDAWGRDWTLVIAYQLLGRTLDASAALAEIERNHADRPFAIAQLHAYRGEIDQAFSWLDRAYRQRDYKLTYIKADPSLKNLRDDPRFKAFLRKMNLPE